MPKHPCVYILTNQRNGTLYTGVTGNIGARMILHREGRGSKFAAKYGLTRLVWHEFHQDFGYAIAREKNIKAWRRAWKLRLIEATNPDWQDWFDTIAMWAPID